MKKLFFLAVAGALTLPLCAQYKKASYFTKDGRTYSLSGIMHAIGNGQGSPVGVEFQNGIDQPDKKTFGYWQLGYIPGHKFAYESTGTNGTMGSTPTTFTIEGKTRSTWYYGYVFGFHLTNLEADSKFEPFAALGLNLVLIGRATDETMNDMSSGTYAYYSIDKYPSDSRLTGTAMGIVGCIFNFAKNVGIKLDAGYNYSFTSKDASGSYQFYTSHLFAGLGLRLHIIE